MGNSDCNWSNVGTSLAIVSGAATGNTWIGFQGNNGATTGSLSFNPYGGNVGIGKTGPSYLLDFEASGGGYYSAVDHQFHNGSTRAIKEEIRDSEIDVISILNDIKIKQYKYPIEKEQFSKISGMTEDNAPLHIGFIADETHRLLTGADGNSMATGDCISFLIAVCKEQNILIEDLQNRINVLEGNVNIETSTGLK